jgi:rubredoxin
MLVNLKCKKCKIVYDFEVGRIATDKNYRLVFENDTICPNCGAKNEDLLTEFGQTQMTIWHMNNLF